MFAVPNLSSLEPETKRSFEFLLASLNAFLGVSFDEDGGITSQATATVSAIGFPVGAITAYGGAVAPSGWLVCDGSALSRGTYAALFAVIGTTFGAGDGTTTFNLPDLRGRFPLGKSTSGTGSTLGGTGGLIDHVHSGPSHTHTVTTGAPSATIAVQSGAGTTVATDTHTHSATSGASGAGNTGTANPPFQAVTYLMLVE